MLRVLILKNERSVWKPIFEMRASLTFHETSILILSQVAKKNQHIIINYKKKNFSPLFFKNRIIVHCKLS